MDSDRRHRNKLLSELLTYDHQKPTQVKDHGRRVDEFIAKAGACASTYNENIMPAIDEAGADLMKTMGESAEHVAAQTFGVTGDACGVLNSSSSSTLPPSFPF